MKTPVLWRGFRVMVSDGTKIIIPRTEETITVYGLPSGRTGHAYYPQIHAIGFFDLATRTFSTADLSSGKPDERGAVLRRILQHIGGALLAYNLAAILRNAAKPPELFPDQEGTAMPALSAAFHAMKSACRRSEDANRSAAQARGQATWMASMARSG